ncbi:MAG: hypothetical protein ACM3ME_02060 [Chloroflexota bacterium]
MKKTALFIIIILVISCKKEGDIPTYNDKYIIELDQNNVIYKVQHFKGVIFDFVQDYTYANEYVRVTKHNKLNSLMSINQYYLTNGLSDSCVDSTFTGGQVKSVSIDLYEYNQGYRIKEKHFYSNNQGIVDFSNPILIENVYADGNLIQFIVMDQCTGNYYFSEQPSKINISSFQGDYMGKQNANLYVQYSPGGCPSGPSTVFPDVRYSYTLNSEGYVTKRVKNTTNAHHSSEEGTKERTITQFEYVFR